MLVISLMVLLLMVNCLVTMMVGLQPLTFLVMNSCMACNLVIIHTGWEFNLKGRLKRQKFLSSFWPTFLDSLKIVIGQLNHA